MSNKYNNILVFDTATSACSVALKTSKGIYSRHKEEANIHSQALLVMIDELLSDASLNLQDIDYLAVGVGPGSFTGLRIGIGVAQGLAYSNQITLIPISSLEMIAINAVDFLTKSTGSETVPKKIVVAHDARMSEVYSASYDFVTDSRLKDVGGVFLSPPEGVIIPEGDVYLCGNAWSEYAGKFDELSSEFVDGEISFFPDAEKAVIYIENNLSEFVTVNWDELVPMYVRNDVAKKAKAK